MVKKSENFSIQKNPEIQNLENKFDILLNKMNQQTDYLENYMKDISKQQTFTEIEQKSQKTVIIPENDQQNVMKSEKTIIQNNAVKEIEKDPIFLRENIVKNEIFDQKNTDNSIPKTSNFIKKLTFFNIKKTWKMNYNYN